jgi:hypothetical protein
MSLLKFSIVNDDDSIQSNDENIILLNTDQIVSIRPIKISTKSQKVIDGFWIRLTNGKKYKATRVPEIISAIFNESLPSIKLNDEVTHTLNIQ